MARKKINRNIPDATPRHLWLATLGLAVIARRQAAANAAQMVERAVDLRAQAMNAVAQVQSNAVSLAGDLRSQIEAGAMQIVRTVESNASPLIAKFKPAKAKRAVRRGRKPVAKTVRRTAAKKTNTVRRTRKA